MCWLRFWIVVFNSACLFGTTGVVSGITSFPLVIDLTELILHMDKLYIGSVQYKNMWLATLPVNLF